MIVSLIDIKSQVSIWAGFVNTWYYDGKYISNVLLAGTS